ncbi:nuclear protein [Chytriomyces hyalinus]|nr:nuclear protein [Chytriomyces hyalinus]
MSEAKVRQRQRQQQDERESDQDQDEQMMESADDQGQEQEEEEEEEEEEETEEEEDQALTLENRRKLRREYRAVQAELNENKSEWVKQSSDALRETLSKTNRLFEQVETSQEAYLDSKVLTSVAKLSVIKVNNMRLSGRSLDVKDFLHRVKRKLDVKQVQLGRQAVVDEEDEQRRDLEWNQLAGLVSTCGFRAPSLDFLYGPLAAEPKARKEGKRNAVRINKDASTLLKPQQLQQDDIEKQENETAKSVQTIHKILKKLGSKNFFEFAINPDSFGQSVENIFYISFLVRDGSVAIDIDEDGQPMLVNMTKDNPEEEEEEQPKKQQKQHIIELTHEMYNDIVSTFGMTGKRSIIPTRSETRAAPAGSNKWY